MLKKDILGSKNRIVKLTNLSLELSLNQQPSESTKPKQTTLSFQANNAIQRDMKSNNKMHKNKEKKEIAGMQDAIKMETKIENNKHSAERALVGITQISNGDESIPFSALYAALRQQPIDREVQKVMAVVPTKDAVQSLATKKVMEDTKSTVSIMNTIKMKEENERQTASRLSRAMLNIVDHVSAAEVTLLLKNLQDRRWPFLVHDFEFTVHSFMVQKGFMNEHQQKLYLRATQMYVIILSFSLSVCWSLIIYIALCPFTQIKPHRNESIDSSRSTVSASG